MQKFGFDLFRWLGRQTDGPPIMTLEFVVLERVIGILVTPDKEAHLWTIAAD